MAIGPTASEDAEALREQVRKRNRAEHLAGAAVIVIFLLLARMRIAALPVAVGVLIALSILRHHTRQHPVPEAWLELAGWRRAEAAFLRAVASWYLAPIFAGLGLTMWLQLRGRWLPMTLFGLFSLAVGAGVLRSNRRAAAKLEAEADVLLEQFDGAPQASSG